MRRVVSDGATRSAGMWWFDLITCACATWRLAHLIMWEDGPYAILRKARERIGVTHDDDGTPISYQGEAANLVSCMYCLSVWVGVVMALLAPRWLRTALTCSAGAIVLDKWLGWHK